MRPSFTVQIVFVLLVLGIGALLLWEKRRLTTEGVDTPAFLSRGSVLAAHSRQ
jgi:hypothetical protein